MGEERSGDPVSESHFRGQQSDARGSDVFEGHKGGKGNRIHVRGDQVTIRWVTSHTEVAGNETADRYAKAAADRSAPCQDEATPEELLDEASLRI